MVQHITFHLADSLPREVIARMEQQLAGYSDDRRAVERRQRIQALLGSGLGSCVLRRDGHARIVEESLLFGDGERYRLLAWVVMPNHVHVLIEQKEGWPLAKLVQSWKRHTSRKIRLPGSPTVSRHPVGLPNVRRYPSGSPSCTRHSASPLWQRDYWDRFIRSEQHLLTTIRYIENNPVAAGLASAPEDWRWGSARFKR